MLKRILISFRFYIVSWLMMIGLVLGTIESADAQQPGVALSRQISSSPEGLWYHAGDDQEERFLFVEITATKQEGIFQVEGAWVVKKTRRPFGRISRGIYKQAENRVQALYDNLDQPFQADMAVDGFITVRDGTQRLIIDLGSDRNRYELIRDPDSVPQELPAAPAAATETHRQLEITSLTVEPAEVESGGEVTLEYEFTARDIPNRALVVSDVVTVTGPIPAPGRGETKPVLLTHFQHQPYGMDGGGSGGYRTTPTEPGSYTCTLELSADGYPNTVKRDVTFTVKSKTNQPTAPSTTTGTATGAATIPPGTPVWVLERTVISSGDKEGRVPPGLSGTSETGFTYTEKSPDGKDFNNSMSWSAPPRMITDGAPVSLTIQASSSPGATVSGWWNFSDWGVTTEWKGDKLVNSFEQGVKRSGTLTFKFKPSNSSEAWIQVSAGHDPNPDQWYLVTWVYTKKQSEATSTASASEGGTESGNTRTQQNSGDSQPLTLVNVGNVGELQAHLSVRLKSPVLVLVPGESSWPNDVGISGWRTNTADRVEIDIPVQDNWGSLQVNRNLVAAPGPTSMRPTEMAGPEDWFSELWSARIGARPGIYLVPVIVRQLGAGEAAAMLTIYVIPKALSGYLLPTTGSSTGNFPGGRPAVGGNNGPGTLVAWMDSPSIDLVPGESSKINGIWVRGWRNNTADRVEVDMSVVDNWGSLEVNPKIVAAPGPTSNDPANMTSGDYRFQQMWSARLGAQPGSFTVPITVRQNGTGSVSVLLAVNILSRPPVQIPGKSGSTGTTGQAKVGTVTVSVLDSATLNPVPNARVVLGEKNGTGDSVVFNNVQRDVPYTLIVSAPNYKTNTVSYTCQSSDEMYTVTLQRLE